MKKTLTALLALAMLAVVAQPAQARSTQVTYVEAPRDLTRPWVTPQLRAETFEALDRIGVDALRINLRWHDVAPAADSATKPNLDTNDPSSYAWGGYAATVAEAKRRGWRLLISPAAPVPKWATKYKADTVTRPDRREFQRFTTAAARAFAGPEVIWSIWNEPNLERFLRPQRSGGKFVAGRIYRKLFISGRRGIESVQKRSTVLFGETAPSGVAKMRQKPIAFLRDALCVSDRTWKRSKRCNELDIDGIAHHPYRSVRGIPTSKDDVTYQTLSRLTRALDRMAKGRAIPKRRPVYLTEFGIQSWPDRLFGVSEQKQLEERARAERTAYYNGRVKGFSQYLFTDDEPTGEKRWGGFETGLVDHTGDPKRSYRAFPLVLDARPYRGKLSIWGYVRLADGKTTVRVDRKLKHWKRWHRWKTITTNSRSAFNVKDKQRRGVKYRIRWRDEDGEMVTGQYVRPFKD